MDLLPAQSFGKRVSRHPTHDHRQGGSGSSIAPQRFEGEILECPYLGGCSSTPICKQINDSVYELHMPSTEEANIDILFFHGLQIEGKPNPHLCTWRSRCADRSIWPKEWLPKDVPEARVLTISYDGSMKKDDKGGRMDLFLVAESLLKAILLAQIGQLRPVILVGHSYGGLIIKQLCFLAHSTTSLQTQELSGETERMQAFLENISGIFYYATPHRGSRLTDVVDKFDCTEGELVKHVRVFSKDLVRLNGDFKNLRNKFGWHMAGVGETLPTDLGGGTRIVIVEEASARCENFFAVTEDHISICQPQGRESTTYQTLLDFIVNVQLKFTTKIGSRDDIQSLAEDRQTLPRTKVGLLGSFAGGEIHQKLESSPVLGLWGMGGIGKTTLCKAAFNSLHSLFEYTLFGENVKLIPGLEKDLENKLLDEVHHWGRKMKKVSDTPILFQLKGKGLLVVLDDVEKDRDIAIVRKLRDTCSPISRFVLTSRDRHILDQVDDMDIVEVEALDLASSETLFRSYAISPSYSVLSDWQHKCMRNIVQRCGGLPLILEVLGKYLKGTNSKEVWEQTLKSLVEVDDGKTTGMDKVWSKLKVSYDCLGDEEKDMFIDATTFFQNSGAEYRLKYSRLFFRHYFLLRQPEWTLSDAKAVWGVKYRNEALHWRTLVDRALVYDVAEDSPITIHEHLKDLGKKLADDMKVIKRICPSNVKNISTILHDLEPQVERVHILQVLVLSSMGLSSCFSCKLKRMCGKLSNALPPPCIPSDRELLWHKLEVFKQCWHTLFPRISIANLHRMEMLQYLQLENCVLGGRKVTLPRNVLVFCSRSSGENLSFVPSSNLVILSLHAYGIKRLPLHFCEMKNLYFLHLCAEVLECLPKSFGSLSRLKKCKLLCPLLIELPESFGDLGNLQQLELWDTRLERLPDSFGNLRSMHQLKLQTTRLERLPDSFGNLSNLHQLKLWTDRLETLPDSFCNLSNLHQLELSTTRLERLPDSFCNLSNLHQLELWTTRLERLPDSFCNLSNLHQLKLSTKRLETLPDSFGNLSNLHQLKLWTARLETLPDSFCNFSNLHQLELWTDRLETLPDSFGNLRSMHQLEIRTPRLERLPDSFCNLSNLQVLRFRRCPNLQRLPDSFSCLKELQQLTLSDCENLEILPTALGAPEKLEKVIIKKCSKLDRLSDSFVDLLKQMPLVEVKWKKSSDV